MAPTWSKAPPALLLVVRGTVHMIAPPGLRQVMLISIILFRHRTPGRCTCSPVKCFLKLELTRIQSGATSWTTARRRAFANDLTNPQLLAVTDEVNESKGDSGPENWKPPLSKCILLFHIRLNIENDKLMCYDHGSFILLHICQDVS